MSRTATRLAPGEKMPCVADLTDRPAVSPARRRRWVAKAGLALAGLLIGLVAAEVALRVAGFRYDLLPAGVQFGFPTPNVLESMFVADPEVFWVRKGWAQDLDAARRRGVDVAFMGDSCTQFADYDRRFVRIVADRGINPDLSILNAGVGGWSSRQGVRQMERDIAPLAPKVVTIYYGWNEHWIGFGAEDKELSEITESPIYRFRDLRIVQLFDKLAVASKSRARVERAAQDPANGRSSWPARVSEDDFRANLERMVDVARSHGVAPVLVTAPSTHELGKEPVQLLERHLTDLSMLVPLHQRYVEIVRDVARRRGVPLCDMELRFAETLRAERALGGDWKRRYFLADGIHFEREGMQKAAEFLFETFERSGLLARIRGN